MSNKRPHRGVKNRSPRWRKRVVAAEECPICGEKVGNNCVAGASGRETAPHSIRILGAAEPKLTQRDIYDYLT